MKTAVVQGKSVGVARGIRRRIAGYFEGSTALANGDGSRANGSRPLEGNQPRLDRDEAAPRG